MFFVSLICNVATLPQTMNAHSIKNGKQKYANLKKKPLVGVKVTQECSKKRITGIIAATIKLIMFIAGGFYVGYRWYTSKGTRIEIVTQDEQLVLNCSTNVHAVSISLAPPKITNLNIKRIDNMVDLDAILRKYSPSTINPEHMMFLRHYYQHTGDTPYQIGFYLLLTGWISKDIWQKWEPFLVNIPKE